MSTTNPEPGQTPVPNPYAGAVDPAAIRRGHEADSYDSKSVLSVPLLVIFFFVLAFGVVTVIFSFVSHDAVDPKAHPAAVARNEAPLNERLDRTRRGGEIDQPRLEPLRMRSGDARAIPMPELAKGNSPEIHPEQLRPSPENTPELYKPVWIEPTKVARISIDEAMTLALDEKTKMFPVQESGTKPSQSTNVPTAANGGRGAGSSTAVPPKIPLLAEGKKEKK